MKCQKCGTENPSDNKFCEDCGAVLTPTPTATPNSVPPVGTNECPNCKHQNPPGSAYCEDCGFNMQKPTQNTAQTAPVIPVNQPQPKPQVIYALVLPDGTDIAIQGRKTIGRADLAKYASEPMLISRQHFDIFEETGGIFIVDDKSGNGTKVNGKEIKLQGKQQLKDGDAIIVGDTVTLKVKVH